MKTFRNKIKNLENKKLFLFFVVSIISWMNAYSFRKHMYDSGYYFVFFFFLIFPLFIYFIIFMLRLVYQLEGPPRSPFHLLKYSFYFMILIVSSTPFLYLSNGRCRSPPATCRPPSRSCMRPLPQREFAS